MHPLRISTLNLCYFVGKSGSFHVIKYREPIENQNSKMNFLAFESAVNLISKRSLLQHSKSYWQWVTILSLSHPWGMWCWSRLHSFLRHILHVTKYYSDFRYHISLMVMVHDKKNLKMYNILPPNIVRTPRNINLLFLRPRQDNCCLHITQLKGKHMKVWPKGCQ